MIGFQSLNVNMISSKCNFVWKYTLSMCLLIKILQGAASTRKPSNKNREVDLLFKNENFVKSVSHHFLSTLVSLPCPQLPDMPFIFVQNSNDYLIEERIDLFLPNDSFAKSFTEILERDCYFYALQRIILPYSLVEAGNNILDFDRINEQIENNKTECVNIIRAIYTLVFNTIATKYYMNDQKPDNEFIYSAIQTLLRPALNEFFILHPTMMEYMEQLVILRALIVNNPDLYEMLLQNKRRMFIKDILFKNRIVPISKEHKHQIWSGLPEGSPHAHLKTELNKLCDNLTELLTFSITTVPSNKEKEEIEQQAKDLSIQFEELFKELQAKRWEQEETKKVVLYFIAWYSGILSILSSFSSQMDEYLKCSKRFMYLELTLPNMFINCFNEILTNFKKEYEGIVWIPRLIHRNSYVWETAKLIETRPKSSQIIIDYLIMESNIEGSIYVSLFERYNCALPGLIVSICDKSPESWSKNSQALSLDQAIYKVLTGNEGIMNLISLYFVVKKGNESSDALSARITELLRELKKEGVTGRETLITCRNKRVISILYAIHILKYGDSEYKPVQESFTTKFSAVIYFLDTLSFQLKGELANPST